MKKEYIIPIFVPHWGCKKCCTFCNQRTISGEKKQVTADDVRKTIDYYLSNFKTDKNYVEVAFFGGSFTAIEVEKQEELLQAVQPYNYHYNEYKDIIKVNEFAVGMGPAIYKKQKSKQYSSINQT